MKKPFYSIAVPALAALASALAASPVRAEESDCRVPGASCEAIVVTGSRLPRQAGDAALPTLSVGAEQIVAGGQVSVGDRLNQLPPLRATFSQANSTRLLGTAGQNLLDLRGLGNARTLVLLNGRRHVSTQPGSFIWDVNNVPADMIARVDVVTGGNAAIYGSDAVAGVVNFILRDDVDGLALRGQAGVSDKGDAGFRLASLIAGRTSADGRANFTVAAEYADQDALYLRQRQRGRDRRQFQLVQNLGPQLNPTLGAIRPGPEPASGDGIADSALIGGLRRVSTSNGGTVTAQCPTRAAPGESAQAFAARRLLACSGLANPGSASALAEFGTAYAFLPDGTLAANGCETDFRPFLSGNCIGGLGTSLRERGQFLPGLERINLALSARAELAPAAQPFVEAGFTRVDALQEGFATSGPQVLRITNPFLTPQARDLLASLLPPGFPLFVLDRQNLDFGFRGERHERETVRVVAGLRGDLGGPWRYEASAQFGRFESRMEAPGTYIRARLANAVDAVLAPPGFAGSNFALNHAGQRVVCAINADASTANDDPACIPVNLFGEGQVSAAALGYFGHTPLRRQSAEQRVLSATVTGDSSRFLTLPGGPVGIVAGAEYRTEDQDSEFDPVTASGAAVFNAIASFHPPRYRIADAFAELRLPLLAGRRLAEELTVEAAGRASDYNLGSTGTVFAWNAAAVYAPARGIRLRGGYQKSVRAPATSELFTALSPAPNSAFQDPCALQNINNNPNRARNCAAAGVPATQTFTVGGTATTEPFTNRPALGVAAAVRGNPDLAAETGSGWTFGLTLEPQALPGLSLALDFHDITVRDVILTLAPQTVLERCYDDPRGIDNPFCAAVGRRADGTFDGQGTVIHGGTTVVLGNPGFSSIGQPFNYARLRTRGVDLDLRYRRALGGTMVDLRGIASHLIASDLYPDIADPTFRDRIKSELGDPAWRLQLSAQVERGGLTISHRAQYIGRQVLFLAGAGTYETFFPLDGRPAQNPDAAPVTRYPARWQHDLRAEVAVGERHRVYAGIDNVLDAEPPLDLLGSEGGALYNPTGRFFYAGIRAGF